MMIGATNIGAAILGQEVRATMAFEGSAELGEHAGSTPAGTVVKKNSEGCVAKRIEK